MKRCLTPIGAVLATIILTGSGCAALKSAAIRQQKVVVRPASTNMVAVVATNRIASVAARTNEVAEITADGAAVVRREVSYVTNVAYVPVTNFVEVITPEVYWLSNSIAAPLRSGAQIAGGAASAAGIPFADAAIQLALVGLAAFLGYKNRKAKAAAEAEAEGRALAETKLSQAIRVGEVLVDNFEALRQAALKIPQYQQVDDQVMRVIQEIQRAAGVKKDVAEIVEQRTGETKP